MKNKNKILVGPTIDLTSPITIEEKEIKIPIENRNTYNGPVEIPVKIIR